MAEETQEVTVQEQSYASGPFRGLTPNVIRLGWVSFFADISSEMLYPLIPIFLTAVLGAPVAVVGFIEGAAEATASLLRTVSGRLSDLSGRRRPYVFSGYLISAVAKPLIAVASIVLGWPLVLFARVADRFGKGLRSSPRDALLADSVSQGYRGRAFGWHRAMDTAGAILGPLVALAIVLQYQGTVPHEIFYIAFIPGVIGAFLVLLAREKQKPPQVKDVPKIAFGALPPAFRGYLIAWGAFALANSSDVFLILRTNQILEANNIAAALPITIALYILYNIIYTAASPYLGHLSDVLGRKRVLIGGLLIFALVYLGFAFATSLWHLAALFAVYGLYIAATDGVGKALAVDLVPTNIRASALGLLGTVNGVAILAASSVAGILWTTVGPWAAFAYGALGAVFGSLLLTRVRTRAVLADS
ncbi:MAG: MFS transporter [Armatimonadota bacterium]